jgi:GR25 family glycosyltransferase involved in LPS biosynthesis
MNSVYYINLNEREDRKILVEQELSKIFDFFTRIPAENGRDHTNNTQISSMIGCALSHIKALKQGLSDNNENVFIFEDDFQIEINPEKSKKIINDLTKLDYNIILLSYHIPMVRINNIRNNIADVSNGQTTCGYIIKRSYIPTLISNFEESIANLINTTDLDTHSLDQHWKKLQTPENKFYCSIPRIGKQRDDYSDIVKNNVSYGGTCFMGILTCEKYKNKKNLQNLENSIFEYKYFIGNPELKSSEVIDDVVYLPCGDNYEDLSDKTRLMIDWILSNYPHVNYIFKTDDDISFDFEKLMLLYTDITLNNYQYCGNLVNPITHVSVYHYGKCFDKSKETPITVESFPYCSGGGYFISKNSAKIIVRDMKIYSNIFEDYSVGKVLLENNIHPININIHNNACFW